MTVDQLIAALQALPRDADVTYAWDGSARSNASVVYLARSGYVVVADYGEQLYDNSDRPADAPSEPDHWQTDPDPQDAIDEAEYRRHEEQRRLTSAPNPPMSDADKAMLEERQEHIRVAVGRMVAVRGVK